MGTCRQDLFLLGLLVDQRLVNVWNDSSSSNGCLHRRQSTVSFEQETMIALEPNAVSLACVCKSARSKS